MRRRLGEHSRCRARPSEGGACAPEGNGAPADPGGGDRKSAARGSGIRHRPGYPAPILRALCTFGIVCQCLTDTVLDCDATRAASFRSPFASVEFPSKTPRVRGWRDDGVVTLGVTVVERADASVPADTVSTIAS
ncbi:hypothetical protein [Nocardia neocaledoniensis]|uniref:hypothetical protein n=1 Tax=Nocardia neocaledoniensis TaxID=236511 RepID=UPI002453EA4E|nr:hypothetical protein [Nocardia neocaledoniensis]